MTIQQHTKTIKVIRISFDDLYYTIIPLQKYDACEDAFLVYAQDAYASPVIPVVKTLTELKNSPDKFGYNIEEIIKELT